jgi:hypothetical protein
MKKYMKRFSIACNMSFAMSMFFSSFALASQSTASSLPNNWSIQNREAILHTPEYVVLKVLQGNGIPSQDETNATNLSNQRMEKYYLSLSDEQFESIMETNLNNVAKRVNTGEDIIWNKDFIESTVKTSFPELYSIISTQKSRSFSVSQQINSSNIRMQTNSA